MPGKYYEDFVVGEVMWHQPGGTITDGEGERN
jgi:hypothetical protein